MNNDRIFRLLVKLNILVYRLSGGRIGAHAKGMQHIVITTTGAKTGRPRSQALTSKIEGDTFYVVASNRGKNSHPGWWYNLKANPKVQLQFESRVRPMIARTLQGEERDAVWPRLVEYNFRWQDYQEGVSRELPVVEFTPLEQS